MSQIFAPKSSTWLIMLYLLVTALPSYAVSPSITYFLPTSGAAGAEVIIYGTSFTGATSVTFNGAAAVFNVNSATSIAATVPTKATMGKIRVTTPGGIVTSFDNFMVVPTITGFTPTSGIAGDVITVSGTAFTGVSGVYFNGVTASYRVIDSQKLTATVPFGAEPGKISVRTQSGSGMSATNFAVLPVISSFSPASGKVGSLVSIEGTSFNETTAVKFNGVESSFTLNSTRLITTTVPIGAQTGKITVTTTSGTATSGTDFPVLPTITSFTPASGQLGSEITITGMNFTGTTIVDFQGYYAFKMVTSDTTIVAYVPVQATTGKVGVTNAAGRTVSDIDFTVVEGTKITSFEPTSGLVGQVVVITGDQFDIVTGVSFNGCAAQSYTIDSDTQITAVVPTNATTGKITLDIPMASKDSSTPFIVLPDITSFAPLKGHSGDTVVIQGTGFSELLDVKFDGVSAVSWILISPHSISAVVPNGAGTGRIQVESVRGAATSGSDFVAYFPAELDVVVYLGTEYVGRIFQVHLNYTLVGPQTYSGILPLDGGPALLKDLEPGIYTLTVFGSHWLTRIVKDVLVEGVKLVEVFLANGDSNGDNQVNLFDFVVLDANFGSAFDMADLNGDGMVNLFDYVLIDQKFGALGDLP